VEVIKKCTRVDTSFIRTKALRELIANVFNTQEFLPLEVLVPMIEIFEDRLVI